MRPLRGAIQNTGTAFVLWISIPIEVKIERKGARKVYARAKKVNWHLEQPSKAEGQKLSAFAF